MAAFERILVTGDAGFVGGHLCIHLGRSIPSWKSELGTAARLLRICNTSKKKKAAKIVDL
mgnify:CR=1 FL=1